MEITVKLSGKLDASLSKAMEAAGERIGRLNRAVRSAAAALGELEGKIESQNTALKAVQRSYAGNIQQAKALSGGIQELNRNLDSSRSALHTAEKTAQELARSLDNAAGAAKNTQKGVFLLKKAVPYLEACGRAAAGIYSLAESTREYRENMGRLETAWENAGKSRELAEEAYKSFYSVLGEEDRSIKAASSLAGLVDTQQELAKWTDIAAGVWGTFGDSLPMEGLAEASREAAKAGKATGALADALNWAGVNEEAFNKSLARCGSEQERAQLITGTLNGLYREAADRCRENNASMMEARKANAGYTDSLAKMGERIEPVTAAVKTGLAGLVEKALELVRGVDIAGFTDRIAAGFGYAETAMDKAAGAVGWITGHMNILLPVVSGLTGALAAYKAMTLGVAAASKIAAAAKGIETAVLASGAATVTAATVATWALSAATAALASPILIAAAVIGGLIAAGVALYKNWDTVKAKALELGQKISQLWDTIKNGVDKVVEAISARLPFLGAYLQGFWQSIQDAWGNVQAVFSNIIGFIDNVFSGNWQAAWQNIVNIFANVFGMLGNIAKAPLNGVISLINQAIAGINSISAGIQSGIPGLDSGEFAFQLPELPMLAAGGFTKGISIAGEAGPEAVISFDPAYRRQNLSYWAQAGRLLGASGGFPLSGTIGGGTKGVELGGIQFAPNITVQGNAEKQDVMEAIEEAFPEFIDLLDRYFLVKGRRVYG